MLPILFAIATACAPGECSGSATRAASNIEIRERWLAYPLGATFRDGAAFGPWTANFNGYGRVSVVDDPLLGRALELAPKAATSPSETHAGLVTSSASAGDFDASVSVLTARQLRAGAPNGWEAAWILWHYTDNDHFYYFILNATGWELGKEDATAPSSRRFIATGTTPWLTIGKQNRVEVSQHGSTISVSVDAMPVISYADYETPYATGRLGLYCEDSIARFGQIDLSATRS